jgi:hypothetical protein
MHLQLPPFTLSLSKGEGRTERPQLRTFDLVAPDDALPVLARGLSRRVVFVASQRAAFDPKGISVMCLLQKLERLEEYQFAYGTATG